MSNSSTPTPGILYVTMQPKPSLPSSQFHDWYNNEHGPGRLRLPFCQNGFRYRASDLSQDQNQAQPTGTQEKPEWMAIYDISDMDWLTKDVYTKLRAAPVQSQRERDTMKQIHVDRRFYDLVSSVQVPDFQALESVSAEGSKNVMVAVFLTLKEGAHEDELARWYDEEHIALLQKVPGWRRTRRFVTSYLDLADGKTKEFLTLHEYAPENGLGGPEFEAATTTEWTKKIMQGSVDRKNRRVYDLYYTFGPAPRDLEALSSPDTFPAASTDGLTKTRPAHATTPEAGTQAKFPIIESYITTPDGVQLPYTLTGSPSPDAPLLVLINSILTTSSIWTAFTAHFLSTSPEYRILSFNTRGRTALPPSSTTPITVDTLSKDVIALLDALRAQTAALVGVSLGGATALNTALTHPTRISAFVACDTNSAAPAGNPKAWGERIAMCEAEGARSAAGEPIVGHELAEATVRRWFTAQSYADAALAGNIDEVKQMVASNSLDGFRRSVNALFEYDFRPLMGAFQGQGAFLVGAGDGVLPKTMAAMADGLGSGVELKSIEGAGHLPMVERPREVAEFVARFLG
ncbi:alpha/beta-hydrolase [Melanomma pulvis-pyrius CBS 109.77]|uniref:Alpha/beta-hydrolase n=1 Tax=Melanomma pulvis-pyrius CBS 109.77 TaxID=1314802 RepID=A0A6A6X610_9PLEO|nr:alpha/beta-hydrolase [Melanomma pulvis-pyrius CBS 109.77]